jgi:aryl-phospho-beta-D-glucosidase BglC (GH1 family)
MAQAQDIFALNERLGRGVNFGNALEGPSEGAWGVTLQTEFFALVKEGGFDSIRLPVSWTHHASKQAPYTIDPEFMARVQWAVDEALARDLNIIVNVHHYDELNSDPLNEEVRYLAIWQQIAEHFKNYPDTVYFELLNEPHDTLSQDVIWNELLLKTLAVVRESNPGRAVIIGPTSWNSINALSGLELPDDPNIIATVHFYDPFEFTHQGAEWTSPSPPVGKSWTNGNRSLSARWLNQSKSTLMGMVKEGEKELLEVHFLKADSVFHLHSVMNPKGYNTLIISTDHPVSLEVKCTKDAEAKPLETQAGVIAKVELGCDDLEDIILQNTSGEAMDFRIETLELSGPQGTLAPFQDDGTPIQEKLNKALEWSKQNNRPIFLGEFGAYGKADMDSRVRWTTFVRTEAEKRGFSWAYWEFGAGFGVYDREKQQWNTGLLEALTK